ncbi:MAG: AAA family ATPase [Minisyncoccia bacterium]
MDKKIIAVVGLPGSGKSEVINYLMKKYNWPKVYFGDVTFDEMKLRGLEINEKNERIVREDLRAQFGPLIYAKKVVEKVKALTEAEDILVESLYSMDEYLLFKDEFGDAFKVIAVYASPKTRHSRLTNRPVRPLTNEEAQSRDYSQIKNLSQAGPISLADYTVMNDKEMENIYPQIDKIIQELDVE